jgi:2,4-dienoyl-CoA reductase-like NADH-dependent reductase (Old Yellow Enzyme family)
MFNQSRGNVPAKVLAKVMIRPFQTFTRMFLKMAFSEKKYNFYEDYNLWACNDIKPLMGNIPLILVGGLRSCESMEKIVQEKKADFVSMCRPFIRQPMIVKKWSNGDFKQFTCSNCNNCFGFLPLDESVRCNLNRAF